MYRESGDTDSAPGSGRGNWVTGTSLPGTSPAACRAAPQGRTRCRPPLWMQCICHARNVPYVALTDGNFIYTTQRKATRHGLRGTRKVRPHCRVLYSLAVLNNTKCGRAMPQHQWVGSTGMIPRPHRTRA
ncbi:unnamed protein product [Spodoptera exigua]|nr:unnamed protein product [Spodoptera exigua]